jgi:hypothetical protein
MSEESSAQLPALLIRRAKGLREPLLGRRARYLMTSHGPDGEWLAHGWKTDLRIVSEIVENVPGLEEPGLWVQDERDFYGDYASINRVSVGISRLWVEQYVSASPSRDESVGVDWVGRLNRNANEPEVHGLHPAEGHPDPVGRRVVVVGDSVEADLRAVSPVRMTDSGDLALTVLSERDWYHWGSQSSPRIPHPSLRWEPAMSVWVE